MIENGRVVERIMRMGIEHRNGVPLEGLHDLAVKQLTEEEAKRKKISPKFDSLQEWCDECVQTLSLAFAFVERNGSLEVLKFSEFPNPLKYKFVGWSSDTFPRFREVQ